MHRATSRTSPARGARLRHRLHGRGRGRAAAAARPTPATLWDALLAAGADAGRPRRARHTAPRGLLPPLRQRPGRGPQPDRGRPGLVLQGGRRASSAPRPSPPPARRGTDAEACAVRVHRPRASPARATPVVSDGEGPAWSPAARSRRASTSGSAWRYVAAPSSPSRAPSSRSTCAASAAPPASNRSPSTAKESE